MNGHDEHVGERPYSTCDAADSGLQEDSGENSDSSSRIGEDPLRPKDEKLYEDLGHDTWGKFLWFELRTESAVTNKWMNSARAFGDLELGDRTLPTITRMNRMSSFLRATPAPKRLKALSQARVLSGIEFNRVYPQIRRKHAKSLTHQISVATTDYEVMTIEKTILMVQDEYPDMNKGEALSMICDTYQEVVNDD